MEKNEQILARLDKLYREIPLEYCGYVLTAIQEIEAIMMYVPTPYQIGQQLYKDGYGISSLLGAVSYDHELNDAMRGYVDAQKEDIDAKSN